MHSVKQSTDTCMLKLSPRPRKDIHLLVYMIKSISFTITNVMVRTNYQAI